MRSKNLTGLVLIGTAFITLMAAIHCGKSSSSSGTSTATTTTTTTPEPATTATTLSATTSVANIQKAETKMIPGSLALVTSLRLSDDGAKGPCAGTTGIFGCQPNLLKVYLGMAKQGLTEARAIMSNLTTALDNLKTGSGTITPPAGSPITQLQYNITTVTNYKMLLSTAAGVFLYIEADETTIPKTYKLDVNLSNAPDGGSPGGKLEIKISYTDEDNFTISSVMAGMACQSDDVAAPGTLAVKIDHFAGYIQGKAMMYNPRWMSSNGASLTCDSTPTDSTKMHFYTDFVGDDTSTTASLYMMPNSVTSVDQFASYAAANFCDHWGSSCSGGHFPLDSGAITSFANPFCIQTTTSAWGAGCTSTNTKISTPTYSAATQWVTPDQLDLLTITIPTTL